MKSIFNLLDKKDRRNLGFYRAIFDKLEDISNITSKLEKKQKLIEEAIQNLEQKLNNKMEEKLVELKDELNHPKATEQKNSQDLEVEEETNFINKRPFNLIKEKKEKKDVILQEILNIISLGEMPINDLKKRCVNENKLCSRATFYRYISHLSKLGHVETIDLNGQKILVKKREKINL